MKKSSKSKNKAASVRVDPYLEGLMAKLLERLVAVEKKLDTVVTQTAGKASGNSAQSAASPAKQPRNDRTMYEAICADCHKVCEVPFRPSEERPVYCKQCFAKRKSGGSGMPVLTSVVLPPKPLSKLGTPYTPPPPQAPAKKAKKSQASKKPKKKK